MKRLNAMKIPLLFLSDVLRVHRRRFVVSLLVAFLLLFLFRSRHSKDNHFLQRHPKQVSSAKEIKADEMWSHVMMQRIEDAQASCSELRTPLRLFKTSLNNFLWSEESHLAYCRHGKVGTTTVIKLFYDFIHRQFPGKHTAHIEAPNLFGRPRNSALYHGDYFKFTVVRHPIVRLVSAYKDKVSSNYHEKLMISIKNRYRSSTRNLSEWIQLGELAEIDMTVMPTFREFAKFVVEEIQNFVHNYFTFNVRREIDVHWMPFYMRCNPCSMDFDGIVKMETFERDMTYVTRRASYLLSDETIPSYEQDPSSTSHRNEVLAMLRSFKGSVMNPSKGLATSELTRKILALLPKHEKLMLKKAFYLDFLLFGYHPNEYG